MYRPEIILSARWALYQMPFIIRFQCYLKYMPNFRLIDSFVASYLLCTYTSCVFCVHSFPICRVSLIGCFLFLLSIAFLKQQLKFNGFNTWSNFQFCIHRSNYTLVGTFDIWSQCQDIWNERVSFSAIF